MLAIYIRRFEYKNTTSVFRSCEIPKCQKPYICGFCLYSLFLHTFAYGSTILHKKSVHS